MSAANADLELAARVLGSLLLDGANLELLGALREGRVMDGLATRLPEAASAPLALIGKALAELAPLDLAREYTRLCVTDGTGGARRAVPVPLFADGQPGCERGIMGERSRQVMLAYAAAELGFDGMTEQPNDHLGLELLFAAALLEQERAGERDASARRDFVAKHLAPLAEAVATGLQREARDPLWKAVGRALAAFHPLLAGEAVEAAPLGP